MEREIKAAGKKAGLPLDQIGEYCHAQRDGDCIWAHCPQVRDGEPGFTGRHCPIDLHDEERGYQ
jgi:hypothetical protein